MNKFLILLIIFFFIRRKTHNIKLSNLYYDLSLKYKKHVIPKIIHKIIITDNFKTPIFSPLMRKAIDSFYTLNPDYKIIIYNGNDCLKYIQKHYSYEELFIFKNLIPYAYKCDFMKYLILYNEGGIYCDMKMVCLEPFNKIFPKDMQWFSARDVNPVRMSNGFIASVKSHPILNYTIEKIKLNFFSKNIGKDNLFPTGPTTLAYAFDKYKVKPKNILLLKNIDDIEKKLKTVNNHITEIEKHHLRAELDEIKIKYDNYSDLKGIYIGSHKKINGILYFFNQDNIKFIKTKYTKENGKEFSAGEWDRFSNIKGNNYNYLWRNNQIYKNTKYPPKKNDNRILLILFFYLFFSNILYTINNKVYKKKKLLLIPFNMNNKQDKIKIG
jgi:mannosyltransferase OCH1-like enzyme